jgi:hypothetical protein
MKNVVAALKPFVAVAAFALLAACASPFEARVQSFQAMPPAQGQSFAVMPANEARAGSLEFAAYANLIATELQRKGFVPGNSANPDLLVKVDFGAGPGRERLATRPGTSSAWGWYGSSWGRSPWGWRGSFYDPFWGPGWNQPEVYSFTVYPAFLEVDILRAADKQPLFEGRAETTTRVNDLPSTMPQLVTALFTDFPGPTSRSTVVRVPASR